MNYIVLRQSPNWATQTYKDLEGTRAFCRMINRPEDFIINRVKLWDDTFGISFFQTRQAMKDITIENLSSIAGAKLIPIEDITNTLDSESFYLFIDDDDWFSPDICNAIKGISPKLCNAVHWPSGALRRGAFELRRDRDFWTNSYAVSGAFLMEREENLDRTSQHFRANTTFNGSTRKALRRLGYRSVFRSIFVRGFRSVVRMDKFLAITNKHSASTIALEQLGTNPTSKELCGALEETIANSKAMPIPSELSWAEPYSKRVLDFTHRLLESAKQPAM